MASRTPNPICWGLSGSGLLPPTEDAPAGIQSALRAGCAVVQVGGKRLLDPAVMAVIQDWRQVSVEEDEKGMLQVGLLT